MRRVIKNARILTMNPGMEVFSRGSVMIEGDTIREVVPGDAGAEDTADEVWDAGGMLVMPGFVNTHTHLPMTLLRGYADDLPLHRWLHEHIFPAEARILNPESVRAGTRLALVEMIKSGTTCFSDMYYLEEVIARQAREAGVRGVMGEALIDFPTVSFKTPAEGLRLAEALIDDWQGDATIHPAVCAHSLYTCSEETLTACKQLADRKGTILHVHLSETEEEVGNIANKSGYVPGEYLHRIGLTDRNVVIAHGVWLTEGEILRLSAAGVSVAHCPKSNLKLGSGVADTPRYMAERVNVALGTDGAASNNLLDMVEEMRFASLLPKGTHLDPELNSARTVLRMATLNGAKALGLGNLIGSLEPGKRADLIVADPDAGFMHPLYDDYAAVVYAMNSRDIRHSMVNGEWIMKDRKLLRLDEEEVRADFLRISASLHR